MASLRTGTPTKVSFPKPGEASGFDISTSANVVAGDEVYIGVFGWQGTTGAVISGITDTQSNTWTLVDTIVRNTNQHRVGLWRCVAGSSAALTATIAFSDPGTAGVFFAFIAAFEGMAGAAVVDSATQQDGNPVTTQTTGSVTVPGGVAEAAAVAVGYAVDSTGTIGAPTSSFTTILENESPDSGEYGIFCYRIVTPGTYSTTWSLSDDADAPISVIGAFEATSSSSYVPTLPELAGGFSPLTGGLHND